FVQIYLKLMIDGVTSQPFSARTLPPIDLPAVSFKEDIINLSRHTFARPRVEIEQAIRDWHAPIIPAPSSRPMISQGQRQNMERPAFQAKLAPQPHVQPHIQQPAPKPAQSTPVPPAPKPAPQPAPSPISQAAPKPSPQPNPKVPTQDNKNALRDAILAATK